MKFQENTYAFIKELKQFDCHLESVDQIWKILFPDKKGKWQYMRVVNYNDTYYLSVTDDDLATLEIPPGKAAQLAPSFRQSLLGRGHPHEEDNAVWDGIILAARNWLKFVKKDWIKANKQVQENYPLNSRIGIAPNALIRASLSDIYRIDKELGKAKIKKFVHLVETGYFRDDKKLIRKSMTANDYFKYCKIAYIAGQRKDDTIDESLSGRELYRRYADGRHGGLLDLELNSEKEFAEWIDGTSPKKTMGDHPWEIKRGGNTTHIDLYVSRPSSYAKEGFTVTLSGAAIHRLKETICMFLAIQDAGLPITIREPEGIRKRLLAQDNVGIIPCYDSLHRANQHFPEEQDVFDVLHFDDLGRFKTRIKPFITWEPLPVLKPKE